MAHQAREAGALTSVADQPNDFRFVTLAVNSKMNQPTARRELKLAGLDEVLDECRRLLESGYQRHGNWSLGQICNHLRLTIDANVQGYPTWMMVMGLPLRPLLRRWLLPKLMNGDSPVGIRTAGRFVPAGDLSDAAEIDQLEASIQRFCRAETLHGHPGFGQMSKEAFEQFHVVHAVHHLRFLSTVERPR